MLPPQLAARFTIDRILGAGTHGQVWLAEDKAGDKVAIKITTGSKGMTFTRNEVEVLRKLSHPNILSVLDSEEDGERLYLVTPYIEGGDLLSYLRLHSKLREDLARDIFSQLLSVLDYIHNHGYVHRDIKLENILFDPEQKRIYLIDWGFAGSWTPGKLQSGAWGSLHYSAPEICRRAPYCGPEIDIWSLGVVLYALIAGKLPFRGDSNRKIQKRILIATPSYPSSFSDEVFSVIDAMLNPDRALRATVSQLRSSPFLLARKSIPARRKSVDQEHHEQLLQSPSPDTLQRR